MLGFRFLDLAGFVIDHAELTRIPVAIDPINGAVDFETRGVEGNFAFRIDDLPALQDALDLFGSEPCETLPDRVHLDANGEWRLISKLSENRSVERVIEIGDEVFRIGNFPGIRIFSPNFQHFVGDGAEVTMIHLPAIRFRQ